MIDHPAEAARVTHSSLAPVIDTRMHRKWNQRRAIDERRHRVLSQRRAIDERRHRAIDERRHRVLSQHHDMDERRHRVLSQHHDMDETMHRVLNQPHVIDVKRHCPVSDETMHRVLSQPHDMDVTTHRAMDERRPRAMDGTTHHVLNQRHATDGMMHRVIDGTQCQTAGLLQTSVLDLALKASLDANKRMILGRRARAAERSVKIHDFAMTCATVRPPQEPVLSLGMKHIATVVLRAVRTLLRPLILRDLSLGLMTTAGVTVAISAAVLSVGTSLDQILTVPSIHTSR
jgi:hypothetical protein